MGGKQQSSILQFFKPKDNNCFQERGNIEIRNVCDARNDLIDDTKENEEPEIEKEADKNVEQAQQQEIDPEALSSEEQSDDDGCNGNDESQSLDKNISDGLSEFERERLNRIERNRQTMKALGLGADKFRFGEVVNKLKEQQRKRKPKAAPQHPIRRSTRNKGGIGSEENEMKNEVNIAEKEAENIREPHFVNSNVLQYVCGSMDDKIKRSVENKDKICNAFREHHRCMYDSSLQRAYSIDWTKDSLVVAGGKNGHVSVFGSKEIDNIYCKDNEMGEGNIPALMSERLHKGWISDVQWVSRQCSNLSNGTVDQCPYLLTSSNDGSLAMWDISVKDEDTNMPKRVYFSDSLHDAGIFSMHIAKSNQILTASKDGSVALTKLFSESPFHVFRDLHGGGVVKCARWRNAMIEDSVFASSGNDCVVRIVDSNTKSDVLEFHGHTTVTNVVHWNPKDSKILLSTSHDPEIRVFDIRNPKKPLQELSGHSQGNRLSGIYQPVFVNDGKCILTPGVGSASQIITMFDIDGGDIISRGDIGCAAGATFSTGDSCDPVIISGSKRLSFLYPSNI
eukprot:jgi/Picsp_1/3563/NSC_06400-R1_protein